MQVYQNHFNLTLNIKYTLVPKQRLKLKCVSILARIHQRVNYTNEYQISLAYRSLHAHNGMYAERIPCIEEYNHEIRYDNR